jgi:hypothetical protein
LAKLARVFQRRSKRKLGTLRGLIEILDDFDQPLSPEVLTSPDRVLP